MNAPARYQWLYTPGEALALYWNDFSLWRYQFNTERRKPHFHPLHTSGGIPMTALEPWDHVWHRGLWFGWKYLNGVNYWEEQGVPTGSRVNYWSGESAPLEGLTELVGRESVRLNHDDAIVATSLQYRPTDGEAVLLEERRVRCTLPDTRGYRLDWHHAFTAGQVDVTIDRTPICGETPWGGYAGMSWRAARSLGKFTSYNSEGLRDEAVEHERARWVDLTGQADGGRQLFAGLTMFDHPDNPRYPNHWRCIMTPGFGYINPSLVLAEPFILSAGERFDLRYRVLVHDGLLDATALEDEFSRFLIAPQ